VAEPAHAEHFENLERQAHAARLGMWVFLASEVLLFAGLFALYFGYRLVALAGFAAGIAHNARVAGTVNTVVLICSSFAVAMAVDRVRRGRRATAVLLLAIAIALGGVFLVIKGLEYRAHFHDGVWPGMRGRFFLEHAIPGVGVFYTLYFLMTGLHAIHVIVGMGVLTFAMRWVARTGDARAVEHRVEVAAMYWHLIDVIWIFLWPMFYLMHGG
jgi:cytochrome c oxidase subunit 3